jgi:hypothetical protein
VPIRQCSSKERADHTECVGIEGVGNREKASEEEEPTDSDHDW